MLVWGYYVSVYNLTENRITEIFDFGFETEADAEISAEEKVKKMEKDGETIIIPILSLGQIDDEDEESDIHPYEKSIPLTPIEFTVPSSTFILPDRLVKIPPL